MSDKENPTVDSAPRVRHVFRMRRAQDRTFYVALRPLVPATASPRRLEMLQGLGALVQPRPIALEPAPQPDETPEAYALRASAAKAEACVADLPADLRDAVVLAADTIVNIDGKILGKPRDAEHAVDMLLRLSGREHRVITGCSFRGPDLREDFTVASRVVFIPFDRSTAQAYVDCGEPMDKAGAYAVQGAGACLVSEIHGSWTNVVGLPLAEVFAVLLKHKVIELRSCQTPPV